MLKKKTVKRKKEYKIQDYVWNEFGLPIPEKEYIFHNTRKWRMDYAFVNVKLAIEIEGINPKGKSRHTTASGFIEDTVKYNSAAELGWTILRYVQKKVFYEQIKRVYDRRLKNGTRCNSV